jgi:hypothetical protein
MKKQRLTISIDTADLSDQDDGWNWTEDVMGEIGGMLRKMADLCAHNAALPAGPILASNGDLVGTIEWEDA